VQGGDPTGTGTGGESIFGGPFEDEFHSRLQFRRRALVACANEADTPNSNKSQFFVTLGRSDWLTKKNTIFGTVTGDTIYNLMKFNDLEVDGEDRPTDAPHIVGTQVVWNPFDDIIPRVAGGPIKGDGSSPQKKNSNRGRVRNKNLLSFGDDELEGEDTSFFGKKKPAKRQQEKPPAAPSKAKVVKTSLVGEGEEDKANNKPSTSNHPNADSKAGGASAGGGALALQERMMSRVSELRREMNDAKESTEKDAPDQGGKKKKAKSSSSKPSLKKTLNMKLARLKDSDLYTESEARRRTTKRKRKLTADREQETLARLQKFTSGLRGDKKKGEKKEKNDEAARVDAHLERRQKTVPAAWRVDDYLTAEDDQEDDLKSHVLSFQKGQRTSDDMIKRDNVDDYEVHDPLLEKGKAKWNRKQAEKKRANRKWNG
jgi:peptidyl-prolyl cis-trans isomerase SDCCAG10